MIAIPIVSVPVPGGEVARRFSKEAKENEKKRGTHRFSEESSIFRQLLGRWRKMLTE
ncbi:MAG: hypothetical protein LBC47_05560 [Tannerella sp.]|jgi:hypothetical protein|nr:hypothetical protein [Tannerella sp.]